MLKGTFLSLDPLVQRSIFIQKHSAKRPASSFFNWLPTVIFYLIPGCHKSKIAIISLKKLLELITCSLFILNRIDRPPNSSIFKLNNIARNKNIVMNH